MSLGCIANDIVRIETSYASGDRRHLVQEYQYVVKDAKERYLVFDIVNCEIFDITRPKPAYGRQGIGWARTSYGAKT